MNLTSIAPARARAAHAAPARVMPDLVAPTDHSRRAAAEERRWLLMLVPPFLIASAFFAAAIGTGTLWLIGPALVTGPGLLIIGFVYLSLTSDDNDG